MRRILFTALLTLLLRGFAAAAQQTPPCAETAGRVERPGYRSDFIDTNMVYSIYLPPCYDQSTQVYPTIYLMHGSNEDDGHWIRLGLIEELDRRIAAGEMPPIIVVLPYAEWAGNQNQFGIDSWNNVFLNELMPLAESSYRIDTRREARAIGGISRGGFWAFHLAFRNLDKFSIVGGHSAFFDLYHAPDDYNPLDLALTLTSETAPRIALDRGAQDYAAPGLDIMHERLNEANIPHDYTIHPQGEHNNIYWKAHVAEYLDFYITDWLHPQPVQTEASVLFVTNTPRPTEPATAVATTPAVTAGAKYLLVPAVAFPSRIHTMSREALDRVLNGEHNPKLILMPDAAVMLVQHGYTINTLTEMAIDQDVYRTLWSDRSRWTIMPFDKLTPRQRVIWIDGINPLYALETYPLIFDSDTPNFDPAKLTRVLMSGVTAMTRRSMPVLDERGMQWAGEAIAPITTRADYFHTSNEVSLVESCPYAPPGVTLLGAFCSKPEYFDVFNIMGTDIVELSGNHNNDYGYQAYLDTLKWYRDNGIATVGGGATVADAERPLILNHNGNRIAWVTCNNVGPYYAMANESAGDPRPGAAGCSRERLAVLLPQLQVEYDLVILTVQYLESDAYTPLPAQEADFKYWASLGADVVVGTQAHWPQTYDYTPREGGGESFLHYGMGNFIFDQPWWANSRFFMNELYIYDGKLQFVDVYTGIIEELGRPRLMTEEERLNFWVVMFEQYGRL
jgi:enterochelin esterase-like enzyme/poly-gamma-glutamate capsule biosynthesis protein CapA/YwtB (metallophosphatase superfamily)